MRAKGLMRQSFSPIIMCLRNGQRSCANTDRSVVRTRLPLALDLTSLMEPGQVVGRRRVRMVLTMLMHSEGVRGASWSWRITTSYLALISGGDADEAGLEVRLL